MHVCVYREILDVVMTNCWFKWLLGVGIGQERLRNQH